MYDEVLQECAAYFYGTKNAIGNSAGFRYTTTFTILLRFINKLWEREGIIFLTNCVLRLSWLNHNIFMEQYPKILTEIINHDTKEKDVAADRLFWLTHT